MEWFSGNTGNTIYNADANRHYRSHYYPGNQHHFYQSICLDDEGRLCGMGDLYDMLNIISGQLNNLCCHPTPTPTPTPTPDLCGQNLKLNTNLSDQEWCSYWVGWMSNIKGKKVPISECPRYNTFNKDTQPRGWISQKTWVGSINTTMGK